MGEMLKGRWRDKGEPLCAALQQRSKRYLRQVNKCTLAVVKRSRCERGEEKGRAMEAALLVLATVENGKRFVDGRPAGSRISLFPPVSIALSLLHLFLSSPLGGQAHAQTGVADAAPVPVPSTVPPPNVSLICQSPLRGAPRRASKAAIHVDHLRDISHSSFLETTRSHPVKV